MCIPTTQARLIDWLHTQERVLAVWRDELMNAKHTDTALVERLEYHRAWLASELKNLPELGEEKPG